MNFYHPKDTGIVAHIWTEWDCDPNPYCIGVQMDGNDNIQVFKPEHLDEMEGK